MPDQPKPIILNVDDAEALRYAMSRTLENAGFTVWQAASGAEALTKVAQHPNLVILDVKLPDISGFEVCRRIKTNPDTAHIPVLHQSAAYIDSHAKATGLEGGADAYLVHPIEPLELLATIRALLRLYRVERDLRESEARYRTIFDSSPLPCWLFDLKTLRFMSVNNKAIEVYGYSREEFLQLTIKDIRPAKDIAKLKQALRERNFEQLLTSRHKLKDGRVIEVEGRWQQISVDGRACGLAILSDVTERNRAAELAIAQEARQQLLGHIMSAQEEERRRISRELHDEAGQLLASLLVGLRAISESKQLRNAKKHARQLRSITHRTMDELGKLARGLHPEALDDFGLTAALERQLREFEQMHNLGVTLKLNGLEPNQLPMTIQTALFRIIQEALTNTARHAHADSVTIRFKSLPGAVELRISDDGKGFDCSHTDGARPAGHLGLQSMRERAALLGGKLKIHSNPKGTTVVATVPVPAAGAASKAASAK